MTSYNDTDDQEVDNTAEGKYLEEKYGRQATRQAIRARKEKTLQRIAEQASAKGKSRVVRTSNADDSSFVEKAESVEQVSLDTPDAIGVATEEVQEDHSFVIPFGPYEACTGKFRTTKAIESDVTIELKHARFLRCAYSGPLSDSLHKDPTVTKLVPISGHEETGFPAGLVTIIGDSSVGKTPAAHEFARIVGGEDGYSVLRTGEPYAGYIHDPAQLAAELMRFLLSDKKVLVLDSLKDILAVAEAADYTAAAVQGRGAGPFIMLGTWSSLLSEFGKIIVAPINLVIAKTASGDDSDEQSLVSRVHEALKSSISCSLRSSGRETVAIGGDDTATTYTFSGVVRQSEGERRLPCVLTITYASLSSKKPDLASLDIDGAGLSLSDATEGVEQAKPSEVDDVYRSIVPPSKASSQYIRGGARVTE